MQKSTPLTRRERWARLRRTLWQPPRPHGEQPRERVVGPLELFYDLAVVVLVAQAARHLAGHLTWRGLGEFAAVFTLVWIAWANGSLVDHAHDGRTPAATAWVLCAGTAVVLGATMLVAAALQAWRRDPGQYRPLGGLCAAVAVGCLGVGGGRPTPLLLGVALVALLCIPWVFAVVHRLASKPGPPALSEIAAQLEAGR